MHARQTKNDFKALEVLDLTWNDLVTKEAYAQLAAAIDDDKLRCPPSSGSFGSLTYGMASCTRMASCGRSLGQKPAARA